MPVMPKLWRERSSKSKSSIANDEKNLEDLGSPSGRKNLEKEIVDDGSAADSSLYSKSDGSQRRESLNNESSKIADDIDSKVEKIDKADCEPNKGGDGESIASSNDAKSQSKSSDDDAKADAHKLSETPSTNQTRPTVIYMSPSHTVRPVPFPPHPYAIPPLQQPRNKPSSLLSSLLSAISPQPPNTPPYSPYGPNNHPANNPNNEVTILLTTLLSLLLRLALLTLTTHILDLLGLGGGIHSIEGNAAFLPSPAQHYTFERVNDRYRRDGGALWQALASPPPGK